jgi:uncharacterized protein
MKLQPDKSSAQTIRGHGPGWIAVNNDKIRTSVMLGSHGLHMPWECGGFETLTAKHFDTVTEQALAMQAELVLFGSGHRLRFVSPAWWQGLMKAHIGMETMDTPAACRTFNILAAEGRKVLLVLLLEQSDTSVTDSNRTAVE